jgi:nucleotide-binding universal stress UspA family protein
MTSQHTLTENLAQSGAQRLFHSGIALDATEHSALVVENLNRYLDSGHCTGSFLNVIPLPSLYDREFRVLDEESQEKIQRVVNEKFDHYAEVLGRHQFALKDRHFVTHAESIEDGILHYVEKAPPDLLVLGMQEKPRHKGWRISSTAYSIATHAPCSVLVLKSMPPKGERLKVLFATDGSSYADKAMEQLIRFLPKETSDIEVFSVVSVNYYVLPVVEPYINYVPLEHAMQGEAVKLMERTKSTFENAGFKVSKTFFNLGDPVDQILHEASKNQIDLIAMGSHGTGNRLAGWLLGRVSSKVLETSEASVAILR